MFCFLKKLFELQTYAVSSLNRLIFKTLFRYVQFSTHHTNIITTPIPLKAKPVPPLSR
jgi:hypothetical protein